MKQTKIYYKIQQRLPRLAPHTTNALLQMLLDILSDVNSASDESATVETSRVVVHSASYCVTDNITVRPVAVNQAGHHLRHVINREQSLAILG